MEMGPIDVRKSTTPQGIGQGGNTCAVKCKTARLECLATRIALVECLKENPCRPARVCSLVILCSFEREQAVRGRTFHVR